MKVNVKTLIQTGTENDPGQFRVDPNESLDGLATKLPDVSGKQHSTDGAGGFSVSGLLSGSYVMKVGQKLASFMLTEHSSNDSILLRLSE